MGWGLKLSITYVQTVQEGHETPTGAPALGWWCGLRVIDGWKVL